MRKEDPSKPWFQQPTTKVTPYRLRAPYDNVFVGEDPLDGMTQEYADQFDHIYPRYHQSKPKGKNWFDPKKLTKSVRYAYRAEQYTDRRGKKICKTWFSGVKFCSFYNGSDYSQGFMLGYLCR